MAHPIDEVVPAWPSPGHLHAFTSIAVGLSKQPHATLQEGAMVQRDLGAPRERSGIGGKQLAALLAPPGCGSALAAGSAVALPSLLLMLPRAVRRRRGPRRRGPRSWRAAIKLREAQQEAEMQGKMHRKITLGDKEGWLVEWQAKEHYSMIDSWLDELSYGGDSSSSRGAEAKFWRQRTIMTMQQKLKTTAFGSGDFGGRPGDGGGEVPVRSGADVLVGKGKQGIRIFTLHVEGDLCGAPLALAFAVERPFVIGGLEALHLEQLVAQPLSAQAAEEASALISASGEDGVDDSIQENAAGGQSSFPRPGAALIRALSSYAEEANRILTVEPQSEALETYFGRAGFRHSPAIDPFVWFMAGAPPKAESAEPDAPTVGLRYVLAGEEDYQRLLVAFKRPPLWLARSEEAFFTTRPDTSACNVVRLRVARIETLSQAKASVMRFTRDGPGEPYDLGSSEDVDVNDAMSVMRTPEALDVVEWAETMGLREEGESNGQYLVIGRCTVAQRAYPLPGLTKYGVELVIDACELPLKVDPVFSICVSVPFSLLAESAESMKELLANFRVRAALTRSSALWSWELVQSDGLVALTMDMPELPDDEDQPPLY
eukprot:CAMPEP_0115231652 /NCGR_PEP_ID=MMETSP0270-20121206/33349_1 /TAXON_ID=71861 /ORGANISM="Scrippsiella trochoidea, Strain CCMP3099" /LENGTH=600 /DNA_ID=CAMNT_0002646297 /DNA_START=82 /DNA_END=1884 /DNA_ORIENTATION=-